MRLRPFPAVAAVVLTGAALSAGCAESEAERAPGAQGKTRSDGAQLTARPGRGGGGCAPGEHALRVGDGRTALMRVTAGAPGRRKALLLALHGAGSGGARGGLYVFRGGWDVPGLVIVAPAAAGSTWSFLRGDDVDLEVVDRALRRAFARCRVHPARVAVGGFSDGATYALRLGLANGRLFRSVVALSPGGLFEEGAGRPRVFVAHGTRDHVFAIGRTSDPLVEELRRRGHRVTYVRFAGGHKVPEPISRRAVRWLLR